MPHNSSPDSTLGNSMYAVCSNKAILLNKGALFRNQWRLHPHQPPPHILDTTMCVRMRRVNERYQRTSDIRWLYSWHRWLANVVDHVGIYLLRRPRVSQRSTSLFLHIVFLRRHLGIQIGTNIVWGTELLFSGIYPLPEQRLTYHQLGFLTFSWK